MGAADAVAYARPRHRQPGMTKRRHTYLYPYFDLCFNPFFKPSHMERGHTRPAACWSKPVWIRCCIR